MNHSKVLRVMGVLLAQVTVVAVTSLGVAGNARADQGIVMDSFPAPAPVGTEWSYWQSNPNDSTGMLVDNWPYAHSAPSFAVVGTGVSTTSSDFSMIYRTFHNPYPSKPVKSCSVFTYYRPFGTETVSFQMVNPNNWTYIGFTNINFSNLSCSNDPPSTCYTHSNTVNTWSCSNDIQVRLEVTGGNGGTNLWLDDVSVYWNY